MTHLSPQSWQRITSLMKHAPGTAKFAWSGMIISLLGLVVSSWTLIFPVQDIQEKTTKIAGELELLQSEMKSNNAETALRKYFYLIESSDLTGAWNMQTIEKQQNAEGGFEGFSDWLTHFVAFENFQLKKLRESVSTQTFLVEFDFKKRGMKPVTSKWGVHMKWDGAEWKLDYTGIYYENGWKKSKEDACQFYSGFSICT